MQATGTLFVLLMGLLGSVLATTIEGNSALSPGNSQSTWTHLPQKRNAAVQLCGSRLVEMVKGICRGHIFSGYNRRSDPSTSGAFNEDTPEASSNDLGDSFLAYYAPLDAFWDKDGDNNSPLDMEMLWPANPKALALKILTETKAHQRFRRNISDECCKKPCSINDMVKYCGGSRRIAPYQ